MRGKTSETLSKSWPVGGLSAARYRAGGLLLVAFCYALAGASVSCVRLPRHAQAVASSLNVDERVVAPRVNINTATRAELEPLPGIGAGLAARIIAHRTRYGPFRRAEQLLIVPGISERRFAQLRPLIKTE